jgi:nucleotide-binding universal stress UspA family protein
VLPAAARLTIACGAELLLVHVVQDPVASAVLRPGDEFDLAMKLAASLEVSATRYLEGVRERLLHEVRAVRTLVVRNANERKCLLDVAQQQHAELIVLSAHGLTCDPSHAFGSVTAHLLTHSKVPLLVLQDLPQEREAPTDLTDQTAPQLRASYPPEAV